ncbi:hypothetical protein PENSPDRAFT_759493 [Peniophora sp. CONT]|nr:hypothetical protein PENSPDRAFT_759493 [Peniophora sp. CONT]
MSPRSPTLWGDLTLHSSAQRAVSRAFSRSISVLTALNTMYQSIRSCHHMCAVRYYVLRLISFTFGTSSEPGTVPLAGATRSRIPTLPAPVGCSGAPRPLARFGVTLAVSETTHIALSPVLDLLPPPFAHCQCRRRPCLRSVSGSALLTLSCFGALARLLLVPPFAVDHVKHGALLAPTSCCATGSSDVGFVVPARAAPYSDTLNEFPLYSNAVGAHALASPTFVVEFGDHTCA